jgi:hypothetical protein
VTRSSDPTCSFTSQTVDYAASVAKYASKTCTQSTDARCTSAFLTATFGKFAAVKAAYCNADYLVVHTSSAPHWTPYLDDAKTPPGGTDTVNGVCRTRSASITQTAAVWKFPLSVTMLSTDSGTINNIAAFDGAGDSLASGLVGYLVNQSDSSIFYGLNARGPVGFTLGGQEIFPVPDYLDFTPPPGGFEDVLSFQGCSVCEPRVSLPGPRFFEFKFQKRGRSAAHVDCRAL